MYFLISLIAIFALVSIYFFFQVESLNRKLLLAKKEVKEMKKKTAVMKI